jgi:tetratricopeptide (TPR) repeat protein
VLQQQPDNAAVWCSWGVALLELQRYEEAAEKFREAVKHQPEFAVAWYGWGLALTALQRKQEAAEKFRKSIELEPSFAKESDGFECRN